jgi:HEAT repeat protein
VPYVIPLLDARDDHIRFYATLLCSELANRELVAPLARRIFDTDPGTRDLVLDVLRLYQRFTEELESALVDVRAWARVPGKDPHKRRVAARALGELRDRKSLRLLIELLDTDDKALVEVARTSLVILTRQDFGESSKRWRGWAENNLTRHRIEWLIDGLLHSDENIRASSSEELKQLTQEYYGYHPSLPKRDREVMHRKYVSWWEVEGRARFRPEPR